MKKILLGSILFFLGSFQVSADSYYIKWIDLKNVISASEISGTIDDNSSFVVSPDYGSEYFWPLYCISIWLEYISWSAYYWEYTSSFSWVTINSTWEYQESYYDSTTPYLVGLECQLDSSYPTASGTTLDNPYYFGYMDGDSDAGSLTPSMYCQMTAGTLTVDSATIIDSITHTVNYYNVNTASWDTYTFNSWNPWKVFSSITCAGSNSDTGGGLTASWSGDVNNRNYLQLFALKDGEVYINQDIFFYLLVMVLLWIILVWTLIKIASMAFASWFFISSWHKILWKK